MKLRVSQAKRWSDWKGLVATPTWTLETTTYVIINDSLMP